MAEIKVERKKQAPVWPWIIGILVLLGIIWFLIEAFNEDSEMKDEYPERGMERGTSYEPNQGEQATYLALPDFLKA